MIRKFVLAVFLYLCLASASFAATQGLQRDSLVHNALLREYLLYLPDGLTADAPLVMVLHGYGGRAGRGGEKLCEIADREKFALCYPQGAVDSTGHTCWNVGYPFQEGLETDDVDFLCSLARHLQERYSLSPAHTFLTGMSNGGEMCYLMAYKRPDFFAAIASVAGLTLTWMHEQLVTQGPVPLMEVHGTADKTSLWEGDPDNAGGWGAYLSVPEAIRTWVKEAACSSHTTSELPRLTESSRKVILHRWGDGRPGRGGVATQVLLYEIVGGKHSWGESDMDTCEAIWQFFSSYLH